MESISSNEGLKRVIGVPGLAATVVNNTIGAGIFALPAVVALQMGASGILAYLFCGVMLATIMLCYCEIGSRISASGGSYAYVEAAFGPFAGFLINTIFIFGWGTAGDAAVMNIVADSLSVLFPVLSNPLARATFFLALLSTMAFVNIRGAKQGVRFVFFLTIIKLAPLLLLILIGLPHVSAGNLKWTDWPSLKELSETVIVLFFAFGGFETSVNSSGEIKNPNRTVPLGILLAGALVLIIYLSIQTITQGVLGSDIATYKAAPLTGVAEKIIGPAGATIVLVATIISSIGNTSGDVLASPRLLFAGARNGVFPKFLSKIHPKFGTPYVAIIVYVSLIFLFSVSGGFKELAILGSGSLMLIYLSVIFSMIKLRMKKEPVDEKVFRVPGGLIIPIIAIAAIVWLLYHLSVAELLSLAGFIGVFSVIYFMMKNSKGHGRKEE